MVLQRLQALSARGDPLEAIDHQVRDRLSFSRFLGLAIEDSIPDATTLWLFREKLAKTEMIEKLAKTEMIEKLFDRFDQHLAAKGYMARGGQTVALPSRRTGREAHDLSFQHTSEQLARPFCSLYVLATLSGRFFQKSRHG